jgi:long-chain fatty acid transport protein
MLSVFPAPARYLGIALLTVGLSAPLAHGQAGIVFTSAGVINRSMGGAAVAAPLDPIGATYWNAATTAGLPGSEMEMSAEILYPQSRLSSAAPAMPFGPGTPPIIVSGSDRGDDGVFPLPAMGLVYRPDDSRWTFGLGVFPIGGDGVNYPGSLTNPILTPQPPNGMGLGPVFADLLILQFAPTVAVNVTDRLAVGIGPTLDLAQLRADPGFLAPPNPNGMYSPATHSRFTWGGGVQGGVYYTLDGGWRLGASVKSPQWFEDFRSQSVDNLGRPRALAQNIDFPMIYSVGASYAGIERLLLAADLRYIDYANTAGLSQGGFDPLTGAVRGLGWRSIWALSLGAQYCLTEKASVRLGYSYNQDPETNLNSIFNVASPTIIQHAIYFGASYQLSDQLTMSIAYAHGFENSISGPIITPFATVPGSFVQNTASADTFLFGFTVLFGHCTHEAHGESAVVSGL